MTDEFKAANIIEEYCQNNLCVPRTSIYLEDMFYLRGLAQRNLYINEDIDDDTASEIAMHIMQYNKEDMGKDASSREAIKLFICSRGGSVDAGYEIIDVIANSITPVYTINTGYQYSMAFLIGLAGHKRYATSNAKFLMHDGTNYVIDSSTKAQDRMDFMKKIEERTKDYVLSRSKLTADEYDNKLRVEWYMFADEAKERGFVDYIIGVDCDLNDVL